MRLKSNVVVTQEQNSSIMDSIKNIKNEIGSDFFEKPNLNDYENGIFCEETRWFESGRTALEYIIADIKNKYEAKRAFIPSWCCESMIIPFKKAGISVSFYPVYLDANSSLVQEVPQTDKEDIILVMDYFGFVKNVDFSEVSGIVIRDVTHSLFSKKYQDADYIFGSVRKWCGIITGGYACSKSVWSCIDKEIFVRDKYISLRKQAMKIKREYIYNERVDKKYLSFFREAESMLDDRIDYIAGADEEDVFASKFLDKGEIIEKRRQNAEVLLSELSDITLFSCLGEDDCPLFVPIIVAENKRDLLYKHLIQSEIYCPIHWPISDYHILDENTIKLYQQEISLVCDQRYDTTDMMRIVEVIHAF